MTFVIDTKGDFNRNAHVEVAEKTVEVRLGNLATRSNLTLEIRKRAEQFPRESTCSEFGESEYFGGYNIAGDFSSSSGFFTSGNENRLDQTVSRLHGRG